MQVKIQRASMRPYRRILVISDIHGHGHLLKRLLEKAEFSGEDALVIVGDIIEKGLDNLGTLRYVMNLSKQSNVFPLVGNVDLWRITLLQDDTKENQQEVISFCKMAKAWWGSSLVGEMMAEMGLDLEKDGEMPGLFSMLRSRFPEEIGFIQSLPTLLETENFHFVHGGLPHEQVEDLKGENPFSLLKNDDFLSRGLSFDRWVIVGHWPVALYNENLLQHGPVMEKERHILAIDGGCGVRGDGQLNLVITDWEGKHFSHLSATDKARIRAVDGQAASQSCRNIRWHDPVVELVEKGEKWATVRHHGYEMQIPIHFLQRKEEQWVCYNLTDYRLPVTPGDELDFIFEHDGILYGKKNDVCGWYEGRYQIIKEQET